MTRLCMPPWLTKAEVGLAKKKVPSYFGYKKRFQKLMQFAYGNYRHTSPQYRQMLLNLLGELERRNQK